MRLTDQQLEYVITSVHEHEAHEAADRIMEHIADLEKSLEAAREEKNEALRQKQHAWERHAEKDRAYGAVLKERDQHQQSAEVWRKRVEAAADALADVLPGEVGRLDLLARIAELKRQRDEARELYRLTFEGQPREVALRRELDEARAELAAIKALPEQEWAEVCSTIAQGLALHARKDQPQAKAMLAALDRGKVYVDKLRARLKPSGQVAEDDAETIREFIIAQEEPSDFALDALRRLDAKAQGYDAAVAGNAAWRDIAAELHRAAPAARAGDDEATLAQWDGAKANYYKLRALPHHGAALLERMKRLEGGLEALRSVRTYARSLTDVEPTRVIGRELLERLASHSVTDLLDGQP